MFVGIFRESPILSSTHVLLYSTSVNAADHLAGKQCIFLKLHDSHLSVFSSMAVAQQGGPDYEYNLHHPSSSASLHFYVQIFNPTTSLVYGRGGGQTSFPTRGTPQIHLISRGLKCCVCPTRVPTRLQLSPGTHRATILSPPRLSLHWSHLCKHFHAWNIGQPCSLVLSQKFLGYSHIYSPG